MPSDAQLRQRVYRKMGVRRRQQVRHQQRRLHRPWSAGGDGSRRDYNQWGEKMSEVVQLRCVEGAPLTRVVEEDRLDPKRRRAKLKAREAPPPRPRSAYAHPSAQQRSAPTETVRSYWSSSDPVEVFKRRSEPTPLMRKQMQMTQTGSSRAPRALQPGRAMDGPATDVDGDGDVECCGSSWGVATR